ncbi:MAG: FtsH protease activity modulator HflK [Deltaproteobacteria bacterium]|jgi:membrane protease subunit HflK|nr:FtsH protease activity modulator HflK [Deltaproteobacteria bacterium]
MNWDWDKLQEKRQRQPRPSSGGGRDAGSGGGDHEPPRRRDLGGLPPDPLRKIRELAAPGGKTLWWLTGGVFVLWLLSGIYIVEPDEEGVVLRFGEYNRSVPPGPHYHLPFPIESVETPKVTQVQRIEVGFRSLARSGGQTQMRAIPEEASTLTGDENIVNVQFSVQYKIRDAVEYLFRVDNQAAVVQSAAEAAMREVIGTSEIDSALTDGKLKIQDDATRLLQNILDRYEVGVQVIAVQLQDVHPPQDVIEAFKDVASAREDKSRIINEAEAYRNEILPKARGQAAEMVNKAQAYRATRIRAAEGEAGRFAAVLAEYQKAKDVTKKRLYYETLEEILSSADMEKIILPPGATDRTLPLLPLDVLGKRPARPTQPKGGD